ncbi:MucR family transcriptional regulator [Blastococcus sp. TF02-8]|uniref:MucR family transcriptional regulator n=1 Tax=Blastococcus sp. TF02-8 TaxID=2250574 RepID=UPI000DE9B25A|nr:MucR family transcriptional regulator [Blastococcus sp. TF02-8]RBY96104.1 MucR family transcriptional regulator [Blastococcus sp. TF02-8]
MLHPVGPLPAAVYWRRRLVVLVVLVALVGGLTWLTLVLLDRRTAGQGAASESARATEVPALDRIVPSVGAVRTPDEPSPAPARSDANAPAPAAPEPGGPCADAALGLEVRTPGVVAVGSKPTFELVVTNTGAVPCVRALDKELQELVLVDSAGGRVWGSNDCFPESSDEQRTLAPGESVVVPVVWGGRTSEPSCSTPRTTPAPGSYLVRARLDTKVSPDAPLVLQ